MRLSSSTSEAEKLLPTSMKVGKLPCTAHWGFAAHLARQVLLLAGNFARFDWVLMSGQFFVAVTWTWMTENDNRALTVSSALSRCIVVVGGSATKRARSAA